MRCLLRHILILIEVLYFISLMSVSIVSGHVGERCPLVILFRTCMAQNAYCDKDNICQCKPDYPVKVDDHTCKKARKIRERCSKTAECSYQDPNSYCTQLSYRSVCECHDGFTHNAEKDICEQIPEESSSGPSLLLPISVGLSLALACLLCCCLASVHICRIRRRRRNRRNGSSRPVSMSGHRTNSNDGIRWTHRLPSTPSAPADLVNLPPYDVAVTLQPMKEPEMIDELPPSYDEVMKDS